MDSSQEYDYGGTAKIWMPAEDESSPEGFENDEGETSFRVLSITGDGKAGIETIYDTSTRAHAVRCVQDNGDIHGACGELVGNSDPFPLLHREPNKIGARQLVLDDSKTLNSLCFYAGESSLDSYRLALFSDNNGQPGNVLVSSELGRVVRGKNTAIVPATELEAGTYWIVFHFESIIIAISIIVCFKMNQHLIA